MKRVSLSLGLLLGIAGVMNAAKAAAAPATPPAGASAQESAPGTRANATVSPKRFSPRYQRQVPIPSPDLRARFEAAMAREREGRQVPPSQGPEAGPGDVPPTHPAAAGPLPARGRARNSGHDASRALLMASGTLVTFQSEVVVPPTTPSSGINEPSLGQAGKDVLVSGNWYLARSTNGGATWSFTSPWTDMSDFCCDQEVLHDRGRSLFVWYRQGVPDASGENRFLVSASTDAGANWCEYSIGPGDLSPNFAKGTRFDFPHLALSNNFLYIHTGMNPGGAALIRLPLDEMQSCSSFSFWWWGQTSYWAAPVQGATTVMYIGDHQAKSTSFRIYQQPEAISGITWTDVPIPAWQLEQGNTCPSQDGNNWCARSDSVIRAAWLGHGQAGFLWNAKEGGGFPFPYIEGAIFDAGSLAYLGRPALWAPTGAWHYANASPNARGDVGGVAYFSTPTSFPSPVVIVRDDFTAGPAPWDAVFLTLGAASGKGWGDYVRARAFQPSQLGWGISAYTLQQAGAGSFGAESRYYLVARGRDLPSVADWWQK